jgi:predicted PurR-regulated permease PerM
MLAGGSLLGLTGVIISVPLTAIINVLIQFAIAEYEKSEYYAGDKKKKAK